MYKPVRRHIEYNYNSLAINTCKRTLGFQIHIGYALVKHSSCQCVVATNAKCS